MTRPWHLIEADRRDDAVLLLWDAAQSMRRRNDDAAATTHAVPPARRNGAKEPKGRRGGIGTRLFNLIAASPGTDFGTLATQLYGADNAKNRNRLRSVIMSLKKSNRVQQISAGKWEVTKEH